jgi:hypothetical protein
VSKADFIPPLNTNQPYTSTPTTNTHCSKHHTTHTTSTHTQPTCTYTHYTSRTHTNTSHTYHTHTRHHLPPPHPAPSRHPSRTKDVPERVPNLPFCSSVSPVALLVRRTSGSPVCPIAQAARPSHCSLPRRARYRAAYRARHFI